MLSHLKSFARSLYRLVDAGHDVTSIMVEEQYARRISGSLNPVARRGAKTFSQADEDGIIKEIMRRLGISAGVYCEYGLGDGLECNTLALAAQGWRGFWISGQEIAFSPQGIAPDFFVFDKQWVTHDNIDALMRKNMDAMGVNALDVLSFDLDSNDLFFVEKLLVDGIRPRLFIVEYNAKFIPPIRWSTAKQIGLMWSGSDYMGASLQSFVDLFSGYGYRLVCCNAATGANAFFVREEDMVAFADIPTDIDDLYVAPNYKMPRSHGHPANPRTARRALEIGLAIYKDQPRPDMVPATDPTRPSSADAAGH